MKRILIKTKVDKSLSEVKSKFDKQLFRKLKPPGVELEILRFDGCKQGDEVHLEVKPFLMKKQKWVSLISEDIENSSSWKFVDVGKVLPWPIKTWEHQHIVERLDSGSVIIDDISYSCSNPLIELLVYLPLKLQFLFRKPIYKKEFSHE
jgi:ligand-binding SRPBCC domain-containing protein